MKILHISYFALLRQERGLAEEQVNSSASTAGDLFRELQALHLFKLTESQVRVAINSKVVPWDQPLFDGDRILLIPPVAGG